MGNPEGDKNENMKHYICIHGHFYQPPRENPWLEEVEIQDSAYPFHDWNERIKAECYAPNSAARILDSGKNIVNIINNYSRISFNFGPTLLSWMKTQASEVYRAVVEADKESQKKFSGHGSAIAQVYNHMIMPLSNTRDKRTQVIWGKADFEHHFGRKPEGMWLPETAVDRETLEILAEQGFQFTILSPFQALRVRKMGEKGWEDTKNGRIDPKRPYMCRLPSGRSLSLFFYDGQISRDIAFGDLLKNGEVFAKRLLGAFSERGDRQQILPVASDGETYGHHHRFGDMALAYCLDYIESKDLAAFTIPDEYLEKFPPEYEVEVLENSSWSCVHGVERWRADCGCHTGRHMEWKQQWRAPLREAMDWLRDQLAELFEKEIGHYFKDPWRAREDYISVVLERCRENVDAFFSRHMVRELIKEEKVKVLKLLEIQRNALLMYTGCGWFFDDISGIEAVQVMRYAARAIQLAREVSGKDFESGYSEFLKRAPSNVAELKNGAVVYERHVKSAVADLLRVGVHYAVSSVFDEHSKEKKIGSFSIRSEKFDLSESGRERLIVGSAWLKSDISWEDTIISYAVLHFGDHNLVGGVRASTNDDSFSIMNKEIKKAYTKGNIQEVISLMDRHFGTHHYSLWDLFKDEKRRILTKILESTLQEAESSFRQMFENHYPVMQLMKENRIPLPKAFSTALAFILNMDFRRLFEKDELDINRLQRLVDEFKKWSFDPDKTLLSYVMSQRIDTIMEELLHKPEELCLWETMEKLLNILKYFRLNLNLWKSQNIYFNLCGKLGREMQDREKKGDAKAKKWLELAKSTGKHLKVKCL